MAKRFQFSVALRNDRANQFEVTLGSAAEVHIRSGTMPVSCGSADTGTLLCKIVLPADYLNNASGGSKTMKGVWSGLGLLNGKATYFRMKKTGNPATVCQGNIGVAGEDVAMEITDANVVVGEPVTVTLFTWTEGNA